MNSDDKRYKLQQPGRLDKMAMLVGGIGLAISIAAWLVDSPRFYHAWLVAFMFWLTLALGGLFFTLLHHLTAASWSVVIRRISESLMIQLPWMFLAFIPIWLGIHDLYHWSHEEAMAHDALLQAKAGFLNVGFFTIRAVALLAIWTILALLLYRASLKQDRDPSPGLTAKLRKMSAVGMLMFAGTITLASWDWLMSLDPHWFSTIFGVYIFGGIFLSALSFMTIVCIVLRRANSLRDVITLEHYHDLGKLIFGFVVFWSYIGFSQYFLIWFGNVPEETAWYLARWEGSWKTVSLVLLFGHFAFPFVVLVFRNVKRNLPAMAFMSVWLLLMHWVDMYWLVYPTLMESGASIGWIELAPMLGLGGTFVYLLWSRLKANPLVPIGDPNLKASLEFVNQ